MLYSIRLYRSIISPYMGGVCRYVPSCSQYMEGAIKKYGLYKGSVIGMKRLLRCRPFGTTGYDPVP